MAQTRTYTRSFAGGEVSPEMWGRIDDVKFQTGAAKLQNFVALPQGPAENRAGTAFVREVKDSTKRTRLIPFTFSTTQTMVLEMGAGYFRFHTQGATIGPGTPTAYSTTKTISAVNTGTETFTSNTHGYANGTPVQVSATTTLPAPLVAATTYYVINAAANTYQLSLTATGSAINITTAGSGTITTNQVYSVGNLVSSGGVNYYCVASTAGNTPPNATYWYAMPAGIYEIPNPYAEADLFDIHYVQSADVLTLVHPGYAPRELRRLGATTWTLSTISFASTVTSPTGVSVTANRGEALDLIGFTTANPGVAHAVAPHGLAVGDPVYLDGGTWTNPFPDDYYIVSGISAGDKFRVRSYSSGIELDTTSYGTWSSGGYVQFGDKSLDFTSYYVVTTIAPNGIDESEPSSAASANNNLNAAGSSNTITWSSVTGAARYNIYKRQNGLYGLIGQTDLTTFTDNNIGPDMGITPPIIDTVFASAGNYPGAVSYFEQRRVFAGTTNAPQTMWMTRTGTESDISYHIPIQDTDRIAFRVAAREANTIRHIVPLTQLLALTSAAEWRISPVNSDTITPTTISVRPQSYVGANNVQPSIVNNTVVYCSARDGHVRELGYSWQASGFVTGDLSLRATHLFDTYDITDMCYSKAPQPLLWFISSTGSMLGLTYIPEQQVGAWHQHVTDGSFESCAAVAEGAEDRLYVVVKRTIGGVTKRYVERFASRQVTNIENCFFVDCGLTYDGTNTTATTVTVTGSTYLPSDTLTITASSAIFQFPSTSTPPTDINDAIVMTDSAGNKYRLRIIGTTSTTVATARVDVTLPAALRNTATTVWAFARDTIGNLSHLEGKTVSILADGAVMPQVVVASGQVTLQRASVLVHVGLPYNSDLETLPMALQMEAFGQGRAKNINEVFLRVYRSSGIFVGPDNDNLTEAKQRTTEPYGSPPDLKTDEIAVKLTPTWRQSGRIYVRQADPLPLTIVGLTLEVAIGG